MVDIELNACNHHVERIKCFGSDQVANPKKVKEKIERRLGIEIEANDYSVKFKNNNIMTTTEIKKAFYKEKPTANKLSTSGGFVWYEAKLESGKVTFKIPFKEAQGFNQTEPAQLLIRWINN